MSLRVGNIVSTTSMFSSHHAVENAGSSSWDESSSEREREFKKEITLTKYSAIKTQPVCNAYAKKIGCFEHTSKLYGT